LFDKPREVSTPGFAKVSLIKKLHVIHAGGQQGIFFFHRFLSRVLCSEQNNPGNLMGKQEEWSGKRFVTWEGAHHAFVEKKSSRTYGHVPLSCLTGHQAD
jgi:hypothetical protein